MAVIFDLIFAGVDLFLVYALFRKGVEIWGTPGTWGAYKAWTPLHYNRIMPIVPPTFPTGVKILTADITYAMMSGCNIDKNQWLYRREGWEWIPVVTVSDPGTRELCVNNWVIRNINQPQYFVRLGYDAGGTVEWGPRGNCRLPNS